nr:lamin-A-like [Rhipicephalus microplus]
MSGLQASGECNEDAVDILKSLLGDEMIIVQKHLRNLLDLQPGRLNQALKQLKDAENKWDVLAKHLERVKKEMQDQILRCRDLSDRAKTLNEQLDFQKFLYEKELEKLWLNQEKMQSIYEAKMRELQELLDRRSSDFSVTCDELPSYKTRLGGVKSHIAELESLNQSLQSCVRDLEPLQEQGDDWNALEKMPQDCKSEHDLNRLVPKREKDSLTFWKHWQKEYLEELRNFAINKVERTELVKEENLVLMRNKEHLGKFC